MTFAHGRLPVKGAAWYCSNLLLTVDGMFVMKVKVEDLEGLLTQKHGMVVMKVKEEDLEAPQTSRSICFYYVRPHLLYRVG